MQFFLNIYFFNYINLEKIALFLLSVDKLKIGSTMDSQLRNSDENSLEESNHLVIKKLGPISNEKDNNRRSSNISIGWFLTEINVI